MTDFDVAVVGAGPAGAWAAYKLSRGGARVALIDGTHPREKACGGGVTSRAFEIVADTLGDTVPSLAVRSATFTHGSREARVPLDGAGRMTLRIFSRTQFDAALYGAAVEAGAEAIPVGAADVQADTHGWVIRVGTRRIAAHWLIGADGANSLVRRRVATPFPRAQLSIACGYYVPNRTSDEIVVAFEDEPRGYLWSFPRLDHLAVGVCAQADAASSSALLSCAARWVERSLNVRAAALPRYCWPIPSLDAAALDREEPAGNRWMLVGDAAGLVDPITREGIPFALGSAAAAASSLLAGGDSAVVYRRALRGTYDELARASRLKPLFFHPRFTMLLIGALQSSQRIRDVMADLVAGTQGYRGLRRRLLATGEFGLMLSLLRRAV